METFKDKITRERIWKHNEERRNLCLSLSVVGVTELLGRDKQHIRCTWDLQNA